MVSEAAAPSLLERLPLVDEPRRELDGVAAHGRPVLPHEHSLVPSRLLGA